MKWEMVKLGELCTIFGGGTPDRAKPGYWGGSIPWVTVKDFKSNTIDSAQESITELGLKNSASNLVKAGTIIVPTRMALGKAAVCTIDIAINQDLKSIYINNKNKLDRDYLLHFLISNSSYFESRGKGATVKGITLDVLREIPIPLPPLATQKRIAEILDKADALRQKDQALLRKYDELAQAVFVDMFGDPVRNEKGWEVGSIRDIALEVKYGTSSPAQKAGKFPYLRMNNLTYSGDWDFKDLKFISLPENEKEKYVLKNHDLVFNRTNSKELVGKTAVYQGHEEMVIAGYLIRVRFTDKGNPFFVSGFLNSKFGKSILLNMCKSIIGMANINAQELQDIQIPIPPMSIQNEYERRLKSIKMNKKVVEKSKNHSESLFQALLQKAFTGELVP